MDILDQLVKLLEKNNVFLTGGAGTGKSYLVKELIEYYAEIENDVIVLGSTGIAAVNVGGQTIHSFFSFGISNNFEELTVFDRYNRQRIRELKKILKNTDLLIIDEISMVGSNLMEMILYRFRNANYKGKVLVVGDFYQLPPVKKSTSSSIFDNNLYAFESSAWEVFDFKTIELTTIKRTQNKEFSNILNKIRVGELDEESLKYLENLCQNEVNPHDATILFGRNHEANIQNQSEIDKLPSTEHVLPARIEIKDTKLHPKRLESWKNTLPVNERLILKERVPIIFTTNKWGFYYNGERAIVDHIDEDSIVVEKNGKLIKVDRFDFVMTRTIIRDDNQIDNEVICSFSQFPIRPAYAVTIHKSQGMSIENLICNVDNIFTDSQFYVALSRAIDPQKLKIAYTRNNFQSYLQRVVKVSQKVKDFYEKCEMMRLD